jgi:hypothetical protein
MDVKANSPPAMNSVGVKAAATLLVFVGNIDVVNIKIKYLYKIKNIFNCLERNNRNT